jgi:hypothetical protein
MLAMFYEAWVVLKKFLKTLKPISIMTSSLYAYMHFLIYHMFRQPLSFICIRIISGFTSLYNGFSKKKL